MTLFEGALFDMDGVLVDNLECHAAAFKQLAEEHGVILTDEEVNSVFGRKTAETLSAILGREISPEEGRELEDRKEVIYRELAQPGIREMIVPGLLALLEDFRKVKRVVALATSGPRENVDMVLDGLGIRQYFSAIVTGDEVSDGKPSPDCFLLAAKRIGLPAPRCLIFEDSIAGIRAALASGGICIALATTHSREEITAAGPHLVVDDFDEFRRKTRGEN